MLTRRALLLPLLVAACGEDAPLRTSFAPLHYDYLTKLQLNVANVEYAPAPPASALDALNPAPPGAALLQMGHDRLVAGGSLGRALFVIDEATIARQSDGLTAALAVHLDVLTSEGTRAGFAEARVARQADGVNRDLRGALYDITQQMLQDMNVEFEYQVRRSLHDWLQDTTTAPLPAPVQQQSLTPPRT